MTHVRVDDIALDLSIDGDVEHGARDVKTHPHVAFLTENVAGDA